MVKLQPVVLVYLVYIKRDKWGIDPELIVEATMYNLTDLSEVLSTPNPGVDDEKCALSPHCFDLLGRASNDSLHTLYLLDI